MRKQSTVTVDCYETLAWVKIQNVFFTALCHQEEQSSKKRESSLRRKDYSEIFTSEEIKPSHRWFKLSRTFVQKITSTSVIRRTLVQLLKHLDNVEKYKSRNKMTTENLAIVVSSHLKSSLYLNMKWPWLLIFCPAWPNPLKDTSKHLGHEKVCLRPECCCKVPPHICKCWWLWCKLSL